MQKNTPTVAIRCAAYNHGSFIRQCLDGFVMQKTSFPYTPIVVDDASTDNGPELLWDFINSELCTPSLIKEETNDYIRVIAQHKSNKNCTFVILFLKYNHHCIKKDKRPYFSRWYDSAKYHAMCEGDDYWIDPLKLQKQVDFLESNPEFMMVCNRTRLYSERQKRYIGESFCYNKSQTVNPKDIIYRTGLFISTCSMMYRKIVLDNVPEYWAKCKVGDYPLQIACAMKGKVYYFDDIMSVYRVENSNSWMGRQKWNKYSEERVDVIRSQVNMFRGFAKDYPKWGMILHNKEIDQILRSIPNKKSSLKDHQMYLSAFSDVIANLSIFEKIEMKFRMTDYYFLKRLYYRTLGKRFSRKIKLYK